VENKKHSMKNQYQKIIAAVFLFFAVIAGLYDVSIKRTMTHAPGTPDIYANPSPTVIVPQVVALFIRDDEHISTYSGIPATTVFEALTRVAHDHNLTLISKKYDFGTLVTQIGDKTNTSSRAWVYKVNGIDGLVSADKQTVKPGDVIEWEYVKPF
jgi:hypothetical protein